MIWAYILRNVIMWCLHLQNNPSCCRLPWQQYVYSLNSHLNIRNHLLIIDITEMLNNVALTNIRCKIENKIKIWTYLIWNVILWYLPLQTNLSCSRLPWQQYWYTAWRVIWTYKVICLLIWHIRGRLHHIPFTKLRYIRKQDFLIAVHLFTGLENKCSTIKINHMVYVDW